MECPSHIEAECKAPGRQAIVLLISVVFRVACAFSAVGEGSEVVSSKTRLRVPSECVPGRKQWLDECEGCVEWEDWRRISARSVLSERRHREGFGECA